MDSEKTLKLSLSDPDPDSEFREVATGTSNQFTPLCDQKVTQENLFKFPDSFWKALESDPEFQNNISQLIEEHVKTQLKEEHLIQLSKIFEEERARGFEKGRGEAKSEVHSEVQNACSRLENICDLFLKEKEELLHSHERSWAQALSHLLKRFRIPNESDIMLSLKTWLSDCVSEMSKENKLKIYLGSSDYESILQNVSHEWRKSWELVVDPELRPGEIRCDCEGGGVFFSPSKEHDKLNRIIREYFPE